MTAQKGSESAAISLSALIRALFETDHVVIVRRVYNKASAPYIGALFPVIEPGNEVGTRQ